MNTQHTTPNRSGMAPVGTLLPAALFSLATATAPYALQVEGEALAPRLASGALVAITPAVDADPASIAPGSIVLAAVATNPTLPRHYDRPSLCILTPDLELVAGHKQGQAIRRGSYIILGVAQEGVTVIPAAHQ